MDEGLIYEILSVVEEIPEGCVATYGQIARLIGRDKNARLVGKVLSRAEYYGRKAYPNTFVQDNYRRFSALNNLQELKNFIKCYKSLGNVIPVWPGGKDKESIGGCEREGGIEKDGISGN